MKIDKNSWIIEASTFNPFLLKMHQKIEDIDIYTNAYYKVENGVIIIYRLFGEENNKKIDDYVKNTKKWVKIKFNDAINMLNVRAKVDVCSFCELKDRVVGESYLSHFYYICYKCLHEKSKINRIWTKEKMLIEELEYILKNDNGEDYTWAEINLNDSKKKKKNNVSYGKTTNRW